MKLKLKPFLLLGHLPLNPEWQLMLGYLSYILVGTILLLFPFSQKIPVSFLDNLFVSTSAVSTTGLSPVSVSDSYTIFGQIIILFLIQLGGLGYMTLSSFMIIAAGKRFELSRNEIINIGFSTIYPENAVRFIKKIIQFSLVFELSGALALFIFFKIENIPNSLWSAIFHSVSSFCTAGFSLYNDSIVQFQGNLGINLTISVLSYAGGIGFIVWDDVWQRYKKRKVRVSFTTVIILWTTVILSVVGMIQFLLTESNIHSKDLFTETLIAFFQTMNAITTSGFNSVPMDKIHISTMLFISFLMFVGASPAGTGGGLKSTTFIANFALLKDKIRKFKKISFFGREIPEEKVYVAVCSMTFYLSIMGLSTFILAYFEPHNTVKMLFEVASAIGTVGLSTGITSSLSLAGKIIIIFNMYIGRVGILTFGYAIFFGNPTKQKPIAYNNEYIL